MIKYKELKFINKAVVICVLMFPALVFSMQQYILRPGDIISVNVVDNPEFSVRSKIRPDGRINFPILGDIDVAGRSTAAVVAAIEEKLQPYVNNAAVSVTIEQYFANKIFLLGDLNTNGEFEIFEPVDVVRAIAMSGGLKNPRAREAKIIKDNGDVIKVPLRQILSEAGAAKNEAFLLYPGDTFYVPVSFTIPWGAWNLIVSTLVATITLYLLSKQL